MNERTQTGTVTPDAGDLAPAGPAVLVAPAASIDPTSRLGWWRRRTATMPGEASGRLGLAVLAVALFVYFSTSAENFFQAGSIATMGLTMASVLIVVTGTMALLIGGTVDISIGTMYSLVAVIAGQIATATYSTPLTLLAGPLVGALLGLANGVMVRLLKISPLIVTIATMIAFGGLAKVVTGGLAVSDFPPSLMRLGRTAVVGQVSVQVVVALVIFAVGGFVLVRTRAGLRVYAMGGDSRAASAAGVAVGRTTVALFTLNGALVGVAATLTIARLGTVDPLTGQGFEFAVLTAAILGGVAFAGGSGRPLGVMIGVATIGILQAGLIFIGLRDYWQEVATGAVLVAALAADQLLERTRDTGGLLAAVRRARGRPVPEAAGENGDDGAAAASLGRLSRKGPLGATVLAARGLRRDFGSVQALRGVDIEVRAGEVLCLLGDNGAGKSTLIKILSGADRADAGTVEFLGEPVTYSGTRQAREAGIRTVYQDLALVPTLSVVHNFVLGDEPTRRIAGVVPVRDEAGAARRTAAGLAELGIRVPDPYTTVRRLSGGQRQAVAIARAIVGGARLVILDEPTAALGVRQTRYVLEAVRRLADNGTAVILITHDIKTVFAVADSVAVLRLGRVVHSGPIDDVAEHSLVRLMAGL
ncbi:ATP-binding cassette domain-containing protein [Dactylosporangium sp. AC04546]|uniref:ATP-binding cassette domain-containing protein n=1 Tax=Dactylosporangium sp. AC04546 TaxID=2862460 RepID=UPI001EE13B2E|nr:ATP-binding cassette domain-containing protein [Dactylosporangium sp. AC04546]WVK81074.1 ATP-binding cassette domain-containing protein [Dactylosporangium sp. AC04546]